jgi:hypothetical protein
MAPQDVTRVALLIAATTHKMRFQLENHGPLYAAQSLRYRRRGGIIMCRNIKTLFNFEPPATSEEIRAASLQFVRKLSGFNAPSKKNEAAFQRAIEEVTIAATRLLDSLETTAQPLDREVEAAKAKARNEARFGSR